nr:selenocysteine Se-methyltransferase-like [Leptinotarsa decemlineata]
MSRRRIQILDGSYGFQLNKHLEKPLDHDPLWSSKALITNPDAVIKTHMDYIQAGVDIIETNTYQASVMGFMKHLGISREESISLIEKAVEYAKIAISNCEKIGKSILLPNCCYMSFRSMDCVSSSLNFIYRPAMDGFSTASGDNFETTAVEIYKSNPSQIIAVGVNCLAPHIVESLIRNINADRDEPIPLIVYANSGENYNPTSGWDNNCEKLEEYIPTWLNLGVTIIGGCCRVCSDYIEKIKEEVVRWEEQQDSS